jgi:hypothetical protein
VKNEIHASLNKTNKALINSASRLCGCKSLDLGVLVNEPFKRCTHRCEPSSDHLDCVYDEAKKETRKTYFDEKLKKEVECKITKPGETMSSAQCKPACTQAC